MTWIQAQDKPMLVKPIRKEKRQLKSWRLSWLRRLGYEATEF
jgi:hypothetical protein